MRKIIIPDEVNAKWNAYSSPVIQHIPTSPGQPSLSMLRLDQIESWASGNKYFKLKYTLRTALEQGITTIVSKGGMFSNHLAALAQACQVFGIDFVAVIRSHQPDENNPSITNLRNQGVDILYCPPARYADFDHVETEKLFPGALFIPEGGLSESGILGSREIANECLVHAPTHVVIAGGTMGTACGLLATLPMKTNLIIVPAWKGCSTTYIDQILNQYDIHPSCSWQLWPDHHFGGFGKFNDDLIDFMTLFTQSTGIPLDPVYNGKMMYAIMEKMGQGYFASEDRIMAVHTGGLQGIAGYQYLYPAQWSKYMQMIS